MSPLKEFEGNATLIHRLRSASNAEWTPMFDEAADEILRLNSALRYEQSQSERIGTHGPGCHLWGPGHYECLMRVLHANHTTANIALEAKDGASRSIAIHKELDELRKQLAGSLARNLELDGDISTLDQENKQLRARNERLEMELSRAIT